MSCIFTLTPDLDAEFPAVAAREMGLSRVPLLCAREIPVPGALPKVIRVLIHAYMDRPPSTSTSATRPSCGWTSPALSSRWSAMAIEFGEKVRRIPVYPAAEGTGSRDPSRSWRPTSRPIRRSPR